MVVTLATRFVWRFLTMVYTLIVKNPFVKNKKSEKIKLLKKHFLEKN